MISVCMATYNGERFIKRQLDSVLPQLSATDEVIVIDDRSSDRTCELIDSYRDSRIKLEINQKNGGPIRSFERALKKANGDYIFLCDQDDQWMPNKITTVMSLFEKEQANLVIHDAFVSDNELKIIQDSFIAHHNTTSIFKNILKNEYTGAMMAVTKELRDAVLPFPEGIEMHDQWIALIAIKKKMKIVSSDAKLMYYIRHGDNATGIKKRSLKAQMAGRLKMMQLIHNY